MKEKAVKHRAAVHKPIQQKQESFHAAAEHTQTGKKRWIVPVVIFIVLLGIAWYGASVANSGSSGGTMENLVAKVNGKPIYKAAVDKLFTQIEQQGIPITRDQLVEQIIAKEVMLQQAEKEGIRVTQEEVDVYLENMKKTFGDKLPALLATMGITEEEYEQQMKEQLILTKMISTLEKKEQTDIADEEMQEFYTANEQYFQLPERVNASHILVATEEEARKIKERLEQGESFDAVAKEKSIDPSAKQNGGNLGFFGKGQMVPEFEQAAFALEAGELSEPVKSSFGYHIIIVHEKKSPEKVAFEDAKETIKLAIAQERANTQVAAYIKELVSKAKVERY